MEPLFAILLKKEQDHTPASHPKTRPLPPSKEQEVHIHLMQIQGYVPGAKGKVGKKWPQRHLLPALSTAAPSAGLALRDAIPGTLMEG